MNSKAPNMAKKLENLATVVEMRVIENFWFFCKIKQN